MHVLLVARYIFQFVNISCGVGVESWSERDGISWPRPHPATAGGEMHLLHLFGVYFMST